MLKILAWRAISVLFGTLIAFLYTGELGFSLGLSFTMGFVMTTVHYFFEKAWDDED